MPAILFGSISSIVDSSELQREAFNDAFRQHDLDWHWDRDDYRQLLLSNGGAQRITDVAARLGQQVDAAAVHHTKSERFRQLLQNTVTTARPGVLDVIAEAEAKGWSLGFVTTTSAENVAAVYANTDQRVSADNFDVVTTIDSVENPKPAPDVYELALQTLGLTAEQCVAIEDNTGGVAAARAAGITCVAFPNENTVEHDFGDAPVTHHLRFDELATLLPENAR